MLRPPMAYAYSVDGVNRLVRVSISGEFTRKEAAAITKDLSDDARVAADFCELIDMSAVTSIEGVPSNHIRQRAGTQLLPVSRRAFVAPQPAIYGLCRMFATFREMADGSEPVAVFRTTCEAEEWLGVARTP